MQARHLALKVIYQVNEEAAFANIALDKALLEYPLNDSRDKGLVTELVYGSIKYRGRLDWVIDQFAKPKVNKMAPWIRNILRLGLYQLMFLDKVPVSAAINESVKLAKKYGHSGTVKFVNGVLRNIERNLKTINYPDFQKKPVDYLSTFYSFPKWLVEIWVKNFGKNQARDLCIFFNKPAPLWIRTNTLKIDVEKLQHKLAAEEIKTSKSQRVPEGLKVINGNIEIGKLELFTKGYFTVQDESSMLVSHVLDPKPNQMVLDVCSGPGGKTSHIAQLMDNKGVILAFDVHKHRLQLINETCSRLGITIVKTDLHDARYLTETAQGLADGVLVDAPCSGLGVLGRRPDARWRKQPEDIVELQKIQMAILDEVAKLVKPGGVLIYSTCTITYEENQYVINEFLKNNNQFILDKNLGDFLPYDTDEGRDGFIQFLPQIHDMDGFFIARLLKKS